MEMVSRKYTCIQWHALHQQQRRKRERDHVFEIVFYFWRLLDFFTFNNKYNKLALYYKSLTIEL